MEQVNSEDEEEWIIFENRYWCCASKKRIASSMTSFPDWVQRRLHQQNN